MHYKLKLKEDTEGERMAKLKQQQQEAVGALPHRDLTNEVKNTNLKRMMSTISTSNSKTSGIEFFLNLNS